MSCPPSILLVLALLPQPVRTRVLTVIYLLPDLSLMKRSSSFAQAWCYTGYSVPEALATGLTAS